MFKQKSFKPYITIFLVAIMIIFFAFFFGSKSNQNLNIINKNYAELDRGWYTIVDGQRESVLELPDNVETGDDGWITIYNDLGRPFEHKQNLLIRSSLQDVIIYIDGVEIYRHLKEDDLDILPYASLWHIIELEPHLEDSTITIKLYSPYQSFENTVNEVYFGAEGDLYIYLFNTFGYRLVIGIFILLSGIIVLIINKFLDKEHSNGRIYLATSVIIISLWIISESRILQLIIPNQFILGSLPYLMVALMGIPIAHYVKDYISIQYKKVYFGFLTYYKIQFVAVILLQLFGIMAYFQSATIVQISILIGVFTVAILSFIEYYKYQNKKARVFLNHFMVIFIFALVEITNFMLNGFSHTSMYGLFILTLYVIYLIVRYIMQISERFKLSYKLELTSELIYIDTLTGGKNRNAFEIDIEKAFNDPYINHELRIVMFDFDNFKEINDSFGHVEGDEALKTGFTLIKTVFEPFGKCYRIGGDEFACILETKDKEIYDECLEELNVGLDNVSNEEKYELLISAGSCVFEKDKFEKPSDMLRVADQLMYQNKNKKQKKDSN
ncbi:diguanylate cyclase [Mycoplasmatota bacterium]|nr:diguanylate cyclase [Mycoplasmatota bacterium]